MSDLALFLGVGFVLKWRYRHCLQKKTGFFGKKTSFFVFSLWKQQTRVFSPQKNLSLFARDQKDMNIKKNIFRLGRMEEASNGKWKFFGGENTLRLWQSHRFSKHKLFIVKSSVKHTVRGFFHLRKKKHTGFCLSKYHLCVFYGHVECPWWQGTIPLDKEILHSRYGKKPGFFGKKAMLFPSKRIHKG